MRVSPRRFHTSWIDHDHLWILTQKTINKELRVIVEGFKTPVIGHECSERKLHPVENKVL